MCLPAARLFKPTVGAAVTKYSKVHMSVIVMTGQPSCCFQAMWSPRDAAVVQHHSPSQFSEVQLNTPPWQTLEKVVRKTKQEKEKKMFRISRDTGGCTVSKQKVEITDGTSTAPQTICYRRQHDTTANCFECTSPETQSARISKHVNNQRRDHVAFLILKIEACIDQSGYCWNT